MIQIYLFDLIWYCMISNRMRSIWHIIMSDWSHSMWYHMIPDCSHLIWYYMNHIITAIYLIRSDLTSLVWGWHFLRTPRSRRPQATWFKATLWWPPWSRVMSLKATSLSDDLIGGDLSWGDPVRGVLVRVNLIWGWPHLRQPCSGPTCTMLEVFLL